MKNPFTKVEVGSSAQPPNGTSLALLKLFRRDGGTSIVLPAEQAEYAAHAINQHEKLVVFCRRIASFGFSFDPRDQANGAYRDAVRWLVQDAAALLREEKP